MAQISEIIRSVHFAERDPGRHWVKDAHIAVDQDTPLDSTKILTPNVIRFPHGRYRMYYTGLGLGRPVAESEGYILSAGSDDAKVWVKDPGIRLDVHSPDADRRVLCPDVIPLPDGRYRFRHPGAPFTFIRQCQGPKSQSQQPLTGS